MGPFMWCLLKKKTKFIIIYTAIYIFLSLLIFTIELLDLRLLIFNFILFPLQIFAYLTLIYLIILLIVIACYEMRWFIRVILGFMSLSISMIIVYMTIFMLLFEPKTIRIDVNAQTKIVVLETTIRLSSEQSYYYTSDGFFLKYIDNSDTFTHMFTLENYQLDVIDNEVFMLTFEYSETKNVQLTFQLEGKKVAFVEKIYIDK